MKTEDEKLTLAMKWFDGLTEIQKSDTARVLLQAMIQMDHIHVFDEETAKELSEETGKPLAEYLAPYWESCGEPIIDVSRYAQ